MELIKGKRAHYVNGDRKLASIPVKSWLGPKTTVVKHSHDLRSDHDEKVIGFTRAINREVASS